MEDYSKFSSVNFAQDDKFLKWVKHRGRFPEIDNFWESWVNEHSEKKDELEEAKLMIQALIEEVENVPLAKKKEEIWSRLQHSIDEQEKVRPIAFWKTSYKIAAAITMLICASVTVWWFSEKKLNNVHDSFTSSVNNIIEERNDGNKPKTVILSDGSSVVLQPQSSLQYPTAFKTELREVKLKGEAFFEVAKNPKKPFIVYAENLITKVLGTSFIIKARAGYDILVQVKTGKVSVFTKSDIQANKRKGNTQLEGLVLTPNQQVTFSREESRMVKTLIENPSLLSPSVKQKFVFRDTPLKEVFDELELAYGVKIIYDEDAISNCSLNASLDDMPLYDKMRLICKGLNAQYEILDSHIIFSSKGCNE